VIANTKTGGIAQTVHIYQSLAEANSFGQAYLDWWEVSPEYSCGPGNEECIRTWFYGAMLMGDPTLMVADEPVPKPKLFLTAEPTEIILDWRPVTIKIVITNESGLPVSDALVGLSGAGINKTGLSNQSGLISFAGITPLIIGEIEVTAEKSGYQPASAKIIVKNRQFSVSVSISGEPGKKKKVTILVKDALTNQIVTGAQVVVSGLVNKNFIVTAGEKTGAIVIKKVTGAGELIVKVTQAGYDVWEKTFQIL